MEKVTEREAENGGKGDAGGSPPGRALRGGGRGGIKGSAL